MSTSTKLLQITLRWLSLKPENFRKYKGKPLGLSVNHSRKILLLTIFDDQDLGFFTNFVGVFIFVLVTAYHYVMADPKFEGN
ncbi:hypothetical protein PVAP13_9KG399800 [Panicum virgatum]|uniref:Dolichyl-diphosphooligosaccharide--protein glycosyltransferase subunit 4 n=1 Tax=Panicum virgatum TaxID=38727 RepID=A0A8T0NPX9_PANVG|nr:hypothetical protein PVAP13_9KG399800 [Panicum virgatum]